MDTSTPLSDVAVQMHELFTEFQRAGFTRDEALTLTLGMARNNG